MAVKSIIDVPLDDAKEFVSLMEKYSGLIRDSKSKWSDAAKEQRKNTSEFEKIAAAMLAITTMQRKVTEEEHKQEDSTRKTESYWRSMVRGSREIAANVANTTKNLLTWGAIGTVFSGLLGVGSLFGLDRLAGGVGAARRSALGLNASYGALTSFGVNYGRVVDTTSFLGAVQESLQDVTKRQALYGAGLTEGDLRGRDTTGVAALLIPRLKAIADRTPPALLSQVLQARGLSQFVSLQDMERLRNTPASELAAYGRSFASDSRTFALSDKDQASWQGFSVQLARAGRQIETVFVRGLTPLIPGLTRLSDVISRTLGRTLERLAQSGAIDKFGAGIEHFADWLGSDDFQSKIKMLTDDIVALGGAVHRTLQFFGLVPGGTKAPTSGHDIHSQIAKNNPTLEKQAQSLKKFYADTGAAIQHGASVAQHYLTFGAYPINNPGNLRPTGQTNGFRQFGTIEEGVLALAKDLQYKQNKHHLDTIQSIVSRYAPSSENNTSAYIRDVSQRTGIGPNSKLNLNDVRELAKVMAAMIHHENSKTKLTEPMILKILTAPGANVITSSNQLAGQ